MGGSYFQTSSDDELRKRMNLDGYQDSDINELILEKERQFAPINNFQKGNGEFVQKVDDMIAPDAYKDKKK